MTQAGERAPEAAARHTFATGRPVATAVVFLAAVVFGWMSFFRLPVTLMPELSYPTLTVRTEYPGAAPEEVENEVSRPIEEAVGVIGGLRRLSSVSRAGLSDVVLEFAWDVEMSSAIQDTLEKLDQVFLPEGAERPLVLRFDPSLDPVMELTLSAPGEAGEESLRRLRRLSELRVKRALEPIKGVAAVQVRGGLEEEIHVLLDEAELARTGLAVEQVIARLGQENVNLAGGTLKEGTTEYLVRTLNEYESLKQIEETVVARLGDKPVRIADLGTVRWSHEERQIETRHDGGESVTLEVYKEADANLVDLAKRVRERVGRWQAVDEPAPARGRGAGRGEGKGPGTEAAPLGEQLYREEGLRLEVVTDRSLFIDSSIRELERTAVIGGLLAVAVLFLFLGSGRATLIVAVSIPASLLIAFAPLNIAGVSLNIMSLGGLALGVGMLVDSSIVVLESIARCREEGDELVAAVVRGTGEVQRAVVASTLTSISVFFPMVFVEGVAGQAFGDLGLAVIVSLLASLAVAVFLIPMLAARRGLDLSSLGTRPALAWPGRRAWTTTREDATTWPRWIVVVAAPLLLVRLVFGVVFELLGLVATAVVALVVAIGGVAYRFVWLPVLRFATRGPLAVMGRLLDGVHGGYRRLLAASLSRPGLVLTAVAGCLAATVLLLASLGSELLPEVYQGELTFVLALPPGTPLEETAATLLPVEERILADADGIRALLVTFGYDPTQTRSTDEGEHTARFKVLLDEADPGLEEAVIARLRGHFSEVPDLDRRIERPVLFSFKTPIEVEVRGEDLRELRRWGEAARSEMAALPELADVELTLEAGAPEVEIVYDRERLARSGLDLGAVADRVRTLVGGTEATLFNLRDRRIPIVVRLTEEDRRAVEDIRNLVVNPGRDEPPIPLASVASVELGEGPSEVRRVDGRRVALVRANLGEGSLGGAVAALGEALEALPWPPDLSFAVAGQQQEWERSADSLWLALALSVFLVYVIMAAEFESFVYPLVILLTIPLAFFGTALVLWALGIPLSIVVFLGMIMLAGIVVNNAIVLVDYANLLKERGLDRREAIVTAGAVRLRPILMTTATTVLGLLPMALGAGDGAELRTPMAIAVIGGLVVSTLLTLVAIPVLYELVDRAREGLLGRAGASGHEMMSP